MSDHDHERYPSPTTGCSATSPSRIHQATLKTGIQRTAEFGKKGLALYSVNVGTKCGHDCAYCSTGAVLRMHPSFKAADESPFEFGYAIVDPTTPERVSVDAKRIPPEKRGLVQLCTTVDAWAPEAQAHDLGRRCLDAILDEPGWSVRILTKNAAVARDFDLIERHRDRVLVGLSITATAANENVMSVLEPNASTITERIAVMKEAHERGLRTYAMFCPLLPGIADGEGEIAELIDLALEFAAEEVFVEPVNARGPSIKAVEEALERAGCGEMAARVGEIRKGTAWSCYATDLLQRVQAALKKRRVLEKLRFLLYPDKLTADDRARIGRNDAGVRWLFKDKSKKADA